MASTRASSPRVEGWLRQLEDDRLEIFVKAEGIKVRASGRASAMMEVVEWFEGQTGLRVDHPVLPKRVRKPIPGQLDLLLGDEPTTELESEDPDA